MNARFALLAAVTLSVPLLAQESASVSLWCLSLRFPPATSGTQTLSLTTDPNGTEINNELMPISDPTLPGFGASFVLSDPSGLGSVPGQIYFNPPDFVDANSDGFDDFFEVGQAVSASTTQGIFSTAVDKGTVSASWGRNAGSAIGSCTVQMTGNTYGRLPAFTFSFELITYAGTLSYKPATNIVTGFLNLTNRVDSSKLLAGPVALVRVNGTNRFNDLTLLKDALTNAASQRLNYISEDIQRDTTLETNYFGLLDFDDGDPTTATADYLTWQISIDDPNDSNANGVPDLSDDPAPPIVTTPPLLALTRTANQLLLSVKAPTGQSFNLETKVSLAQTNWVKAMSFTMTNNLQTETLPLPNSSTMFWRLSGP